ncbi:MAG: DNA-3-methyladenine glycosylase [Candidatus Methylomirabilota bacterium]
MLQRDFFNRDPEIVAKALLGKTLVRKIGNKTLKAKIVETEAYYDDSDPASRACKGGDLRETMSMDAGTILVYGVHNNWLINFVTGKEGSAQAVLLRALEPLNFSERCNGPGLLTKALKIGKELHKKDVCECNELWLEDSGEKIEIASSHRIGVKKDLAKNLRFFAKGNKCTSR